MKQSVLLSSLLLLLLVSFTEANAQGLIVYPANGQNDQQMEQDKYSCHQWAVGQTGYDPTQGASAPQASGGSPSGGVVSGAAKGALVGAAVGGIVSGSSGAKKGLGAGAAAGGLLGGMHRQSQAAEQQRAQQQSQAQAAQKQSEYNRAFAACLESKGYTVK